MRLYLDTEFNGFGGELISLALVSPDYRHEFYRVCIFTKPVETWVKQHVIPVLDADPLLPAEFKEDLHRFIGRFENPEIICDWHADAEHFCRLLAGHDYGSSLDFQCRITILKTPPGQPVSLTPHNALADAKALMEWNEGRLAA